MQIFGFVQVHGSARIYGNARLIDNVIVTGDVEIKLYSHLKPGQKRFAFTKGKSREHMDFVNALGNYIDKEK